MIDHFFFLSCLKSFFFIAFCAFIERTAEVLDRKWWGERGDDMQKRATERNQTQDRCNEDSFSVHEAPALPTELWCDSLPLDIAWPCNCIVYVLSEIVWTSRSSLVKKLDVSSEFFQTESQKWRLVERQWCGVFILFSKWIKWRTCFLSWCMTQATEPWCITMSEAILKKLIS